MVRPKLNCWEYQGCGREQGSVPDGDACPASTAVALDGSNGGSKAGRACWVVTGTLCEGCVQGTYEEKYAAVCRKCAFHYRVEVEQGLDLEATEDMLERYRSNGERVVR